MREFYYNKIATFWNGAQAANLFSKSVGVSPAIDI